MPKYRLMVGRLMIDGCHRHEVTNFLTHIATKVKDPELFHLIDGWFNKLIDHFPTPVARNQLIKMAQENRVDFLWMIDADCYPEVSFFETSFNFLRQQAEPSIIACPYLGGSGDVMVFEYTNKNLDTFELSWISRGDAFRRKGIQRVASVGTHLIAYDMRVFNKISKPYYKYSYNEDHTAITETEDCYCHRIMANAGIPIYCSWDHWAGHIKTQLLIPSEPLQEKDIEYFWLEKAKDVLLYEKNMIHNK